MEKIKIENYSLAIIICEELIRLGIRQNLFSFDATFSTSELEQIKQLTIRHCDGLQGIEKLSNLESLTILGVNLNSFQSDVSAQNTILDFSYINQISSLKQLNIFYDNTLETLDISNLTNINSIRLFCNSRLRKIVGLDSQTNLKQVVICGCQIVDIGDVKKYIDNTQDVATNVLDISMFFSLFQKNSMKMHLKEKMYANLTNISFGEHIYFGDEMYIMDFYQMTDLYNRATRILRELSLEQMDDYQKVKTIYEYIIKHLKYDYEGLQYRDENYGRIRYMSGEEKEYFFRRLANMNSSFGAITRKKAVCDGYVNLMRLLLRICGIASQTVICSKNEQLHSAIRFEIDGKIYYADPEQDQKNKNNHFFGLTYDEFSSIYTLTPKEKIDDEYAKERMMTYGKYIN